MLTRFANPARFMRVSGAVLPWLGTASAGVLGLGLCWSLLLSASFLSWAPGAPCRRRCSLQLSPGYR